MGTRGSIGLCPYGARGPVLCVPPSLADQGVGRFPPFSGCLLPFQDKIIGTSACELNQASRHKLAATPLWIEQGAHRPGEVGTGPIMASSCAAD
jgi:hypothetical protein